MLILRLLEKSQSARPRSATEVLEALGALPWGEIEQRAIAVGRASVPPPARSEPPPPPGAGRYRPLRSEGERTLAEDELLRRVVRLEPCDAARAAHLRALAAARSPFLQGIYDVDEVHGRAVLEHPSGQTPRAPLDAQAVIEAAAALRALHDIGLAHGAVDAEHVVLGPGRAVLLLPPREASDPAADLRALARIAS